MKHLLFVYGTLKKGHTRQKYLTDQRYLGVGVLKPLYRMVALGGHPALVPHKEGQEGSRIYGELYEVDEACLHILDSVEGVGAGVYFRKNLELESHTQFMLPTEQWVFDALQRGEAEGYVYCKDVGQARDCGCFWF